MLRLLTPVGRGAVAVLAVTPRPPPGPLRTRRGQVRPWPDPGRFVVGWLWDGDRAIDQVVAVGTAEGVELHLHGGPALVTAAAEALGLAAEPLCPGGGAPASLRAARARLSALCGPLAARAHRARAVLAGGPADPALAGELRESLRLVELAERLRRPAVVRLVGRPNAGKSTLFNALLSAERALTSPEAGTTRDTVSAILVLAGLPLRLEDTAGGPVDPWGADLLVYLLSPGEEPPAATTLGGVPVLAMRGHADQLPERTPGAVSGLTGVGVAELADELVGRLGLATGPDQDARAPLEPEHRALFEAALERLSQ